MLKHEMFFNNSSYNNTLQYIQFYEIVHLAIEF